MNEGRKYRDNGVNLFILKEDFAQLIFRTIIRTSIRNLPSNLIIDVPSLFIYEVSLECWYKMIPIATDISRYIFHMLAEIIEKEKKRRSKE